MGKKSMIKGKNRKQEHDPDDKQSKITQEKRKIDDKDLISCLPDDILCNIIAFLSFESAISTTFLSTTWKDLWKKAFFFHGTIAEAIATIFNLLLDPTELHQWGFQFNFDHGRVLYVSIVPDTNTLHLDFSAGEQEFPKPFDLFLPLNLPFSDKWPFPYKHDNILNLNLPLPSSQLFKIKTLYLISVGRVSSRVITCMVSNFPFLESLTIAKCNGLESLDIKVAANLKKLVVLDCPRLEYFYFVSCRLLKTFQYRGRLVSFRFHASCMCYGYRLRIFPMLHHAMSLKDAMLDFRQGPITEWKWDFEKPSFYNTYIYRDLDKRSNACGCICKSKCFKSILKGLDCVRTLTLCRWVFESSMCTKLPSSIEDLKTSFHWLRELWWIDSSMERENINALICFLHLCPNLERLYVTIDPECYNLPSTEKFSAIFSRPNKLDDLMFVKLEGCKDEKVEILLARRLIPLFQGNPTIISKPDRTCLKQLVKVSKLEKQGKYPYRFKVVENVNEIMCSDHVHMKL